MFGRRPDATLVRDLPAVRRFMPLLILAGAIGIFMVLRAITRVVDERPRLNRFTAGGRLWQRDGVWITFSAKQAFEDGAPILTLKRRFEPDEPLETMVEGLTTGLRRGRSGERTTSDKEVGLLLRLPPFLVRGLLRLTRGADALGLLPRAMIDSDPMYCSFFVANLGSVGLEAGYHHLWEHGNCPFFCVVGRVRETDAGRVMPLKWTFDERVEDGFYCARSLERLGELIAHPEKL